MTALLPRHDLDAERAVLSAVLLSPERLDDVRAELGPGSWYSPAHRLVWEAACALADRSQPVDAVTVAGWLKDRGRLAEVGGTPWIGALTDAVPHVANLGAYVAMVSTAALQRRAVDECRRFAAEGYGDVGDVRAWVAGLEERLAALTVTTTRETSAFLGDVVRETVADLRDGKTGTRVATGLRSLDEVLACHVGDLVIVAGRPGMGKSALVGGIAVNAGLHTTETEEPGAVVFSAEMDRHQVAQRLLAADAGIPVSALRHGNVSDGGWSRLTESAQRLDACALVLDDQAAPTLAHVRAVVRKTKRNLAKWGTASGLPRALRLVVVDYIQIMGTRSEKGKLREQEVSELSGGLKALAREEGVVVMALSQLNRSVEQRTNKRPMLSDLRESGAIEQDADAIVFVYRDEYYNPSGPKGVAELLIAKNRNGAHGRAFVKFQGAFTMFSDLSESEEAQLRREAKED